MRKVENVPEIIDKLMTENDKVLFNLFYLIADNDNSLWVTDEKSYIIGQTNEMLPMWIWIKDDAKEETFAEIETVIKERMEYNPNLKVTADAEKMENLLKKIAEKKRVKYEAEVPMVIYSCKKVSNPKKASGCMIHSNIEHKNILERFITGMVYDLAKRPMRENEAEGFADAVAGTENLYLWEDAGNVVSMAMVAHRADGFARINTVYTDPAYRGKGYAGTLVGAVTKILLEENRIPMLYTEKDNVCSNATYQRIGYRACGELTNLLLVN